MAALGPGLNFRGMPRPIWTGAISFGLVNVPVKVFGAVQNKEVRFHMLHRKDGARIRQRRVCSKEDREVDYEEIAKGYELSPGEYVMLTPEELQALAPESNRAIEIVDVVSLDEIDPIFWEHTYYLVPDRGALKAYALLFHAMQKARKVAIARVVIRTRQYLCTIRPMGEALAMSTMQYADEIVSQAELEELRGVTEPPNARELELAERLVDSLSTSWQPEKYRDEHRERVLELIRRKAEGERISLEAPAEAPRGKVVNLMQALEQSLAAMQRGELGDEKGERRMRAEAARVKRTGPPKGKGRKKKPAA